MRRCSGTHKAAIARQHPKGGWTQILTTVGQNLTLGTRSEGPLPTLLGRTS